ncbi:PP2C family protein-serine/threonine phosphatase [Kutzneria albida]|uniref:Serine/threonine protein phosphatase PstP n=1 Tax=Kutzneria albida DSM 43870 TaxID=1449976 RepID=W5VXV7_9PSEU|nr:PP2C family serine/threonine-protein phosphatase [Kutzneria albida]AHH93402.1 PP2C-family Ser/Thr phosphatase [Kutzneria albida DSM 43870]
MTLVLRYAARSDRGLVRSNNQDSVYAGPRLLALADGMGGHAAGEVASKVVVAALAPLDDDEPGDDLLDQLRGAVLDGNGAIAELVAHDPDLDGMGTTLTAVLFSGNRLGLVHVGDSRAYLLRNGSFTQITHDDTFVQSLIDEGRITEEEANVHPQRSLLLRALTGHEVEPSLAVREARANDRYLLCSDGLCSYVSHETLTEAIKIPDPQACADRMIELALKAGGPDNVTVIIADVVDVDFGDDAPIVGGAAGDGSSEQPPPDSPASRAGAITAARTPPPQPLAVQPPEPDPKARTRKRVRLAVWIVVVLAVLGIGAAGTAWWVLSQYYVGATEDNKVVIFQGVKGGPVLGVALHRVAESSCLDAAQQNCQALTLDDLQESAREDVRKGVIADKQGLEGARDTVKRLWHNALLAPCSATPVPTSAGQPTSTTSATSTTVPPSSATATGAAATSTHATTESSAPGEPQVPGRNCRKVG